MFGCPLIAAIAVPEALNFPEPKISAYDPGAKLTERGVRNSAEGDGGVNDVLAFTVPSAKGAPCGIASSAVSEMIAANKLPLMAPRCPPTSVTAVVDVTLNRQPT